MKKFSLVTFSLLTLAVLSGFFFRDQLLTSATKVFLNQTFKSTVSYRDLSSRNGHISIEGLQITEERYQLTLDSVEFALQFKKLISNPKRWINFTKCPNKSWFGTLVVMKQYGLQLSIDNGVLQLEDKRYFFGFQNGEHSHHIGILSVAQDPALKNHPFLVVDFNTRGTKLTTQLRVEEVPAERLLHLAAFAFPEKFGGFSGAQGHVELSASVIFEETGVVDELSTRFVCEKFEVDYPQQALSVRVDSLRGDLNYPEGADDAGMPVWKKMLCDISLENGEVVYGEAFALASLEGNLSLDPRIDPSLSMKGELAAHETPIALRLDGKGAIHEDHAYWLEFDLSLNDRKGTDCTAFMSICRPEVHSHVIQLEASHLLPAQVEMLKGYFARSVPRLNEWKVNQGSFGGKFVALFEKGNLSHFEIQDFIGEDVTLTSASKRARFSKIYGEGRLFEEFSFDVDLQTDHLAHLISDLSFGEEQAHLSTRIQFGKDAVETQGSVEFLQFHESIQFGFKSPHPLPRNLSEIAEGWIRSEKLSEHLYAPVVQQFAEDLELKGDVDLVATYNGQDIDLALQINQFHAKHPLIELRADAVGEKGRTEGRAKLIYKVKDGSLTGQLPLKDGEGYDCTYGLVARDLSGLFSFKDTDFWAEVKEANLSFDGKPLLDQASANLSLGEHFLVQQLEGKLPLDTDTPFRLHVSHLDKSSISCSVFEQQDKLLQLEAAREKHWQGELSIKGIEQKFALTADCNLFKSRLDLDLAGEDLHIFLSKQGNEYLFKDAFFGKTQWEGLVVPAEKGFTLARVSIEDETMKLQGEGTLHIDLPGQEQSFGLRSDILVKGELIKPLPIQFETKKAARIAYAPQLGWVLSDLELVSGDNHLGVSNAQHDIESKKTSIHHCQFDFSSALTERLIQANVLPSMLRSFRFSHALKGSGKLEVSEKLTSIETVLHEGANWRKDGNRDLFVDATLQQNSFLIRLKEEGEQGLEFKTKSDGSFELDSCKGSLGRLRANLKSHGKNNQLKGKVFVDFELFDQLFDLPLSAYLQTWKAGGGYTFDGLFTQNEDLKNWGFKGKIQGNGFEACGYQFRSLEARVEVLPGQVMIENLDVTDDAGKIWIGEGALMKSGPNWIFSFPLVEIRSFQPSMIKSLSGKEKPIHPLVVKTGSIENVRGRMDDLSTVTGEGRLKFVNVSKTNQTVYPKNLPVSVIEQLGLDGALFVPSSGELDFLIQNGRCYVRQLRNVASLQNRSEFLPPKNGVIGYLDFNGNLFLDVQVKQKAVRSLPSITYRVRGSLEEPEITIR